MLCSILFSIVNKEIGKKVRFRHNKDNFCSSIFILTTNLAKMGTFIRTKNLFIAISLVKLNHSHRKYSRKWLYRRIFLRCGSSVNYNPQGNHFGFYNHSGVQTVIHQILSFPYVENPFSGPNHYTSAQQQNDNQCDHEHNQFT